MSILQFIASLASSLAWPVAAILLAFVLKGPIVRLLTTGPGRALKRMKAGMFELEWDDKLDKAEATLPTGHGDGSPKGGTTAPMVDHDTDRDQPDQAEASPDGGRDGRPERDSERPSELILASAYPVGAVIRAFSGVEVALYNALDAWDVPLKPGRYKPAEATRQAIRAGILTEDQASILSDLRTLRNKIAHEPDPVLTSGEATRFVLVANRLAEVLNASRPGSESN